MARRISLSQFKSKIRQAEARHKRNVQKYNQQVRKVNTAIKEHNRVVKRAVDDYNRAAKAHNVRVRSNRSRLDTALQTIRKRASSSVSVDSSRQVASRFDNFQSSAAYDDPAYETFRRYAENDVANSLELSQRLSAEDNGEVTEDAVNEDEEVLRESAVDEELSKLSDDFLRRWQGALFSLNPRNPDAARHFCTSVREIFTAILHKYAPDELVDQFFNDYAMDKNGRPTRRERIRYLLESKKLTSPEFFELVDEDISDILRLFDFFNKATHGSSGKFSLATLVGIKARVEDSIIFLAKIAA